MRSPSHQVMAENGNKTVDLSGGQMTELEWVSLMEELDKVHKPEPFMVKFKRKFLHDPLVPIGMSFIGFHLYLID